MHLIANVILTILSCQILSLCNSQNVEGDKQFDEPSEEANCNLRTGNRNTDLQYPAVFRPVGPDDMMFHPDRFGRLIIKHNQRVQLSCNNSGGFLSEDLRHIEEKLNVTCVNGSIVYEGVPYPLEKFKCLRKVSKVTPGGTPGRHFGYRNFFNHTRYKTQKKKKKDSLDETYAKIIAYQEEHHKRNHDCYFVMPKEMYRGYYTPIPYRTDTLEPTIMYPDLQGIINIRKNGFFKLSCSGSHFLQPMVIYKEEISVKCYQTIHIKYESNLWRFDNFSCASIPKARALMTNKTCQGDSKNQLLEVGLQTEHIFFKMYRICFNLETKTPLYSWYIRKKPVFRYRQVPRKNPFFIKSKLGLYGNIDLRMTYRVYTIRESVQTILNSTHLGDVLIDFGKRRVLKQRDLTSNFDFNYLFEQETAFLAENSVPQWAFFNFRIWKDVERSFRYDLADSNLNGPNLIITGTYKTATLRDENLKPHKLYLLPPSELPVPKYVWKMDYDLSTKEGIVYVGLNDPYTFFNQTLKICKTVPCRKSLMVRRMYNPSMLYCCTKESFEAVYGKLDPVVYEEFRQ